MTTTTTEIWKTKNPSYWTWKNGSLALTSATALGIGAWAVSKNFNFINPYVNYNDSIENYKKSTEKSFIDNDTENINNWEVGVYDGDHVILNTQGLPANAPWSEKLGIMFGGTALGYSPAILGACQAYLASIGALGAEGIKDGLQQFGTKAIAKNLNSYSQKKDSFNQTALPQGPIKSSLPQRTRSSSNAELARERIAHQSGSKTPIQSHTKIHDVKNRSTTTQKSSPTNAQLAKERMADLYDNLN